MFERLLTEGVPSAKVLRSIKYWRNNKATVAGGE